MPQYHPEGSGFNDDRFYVSSEEINHMLGKEGKLNNLFLHVVRFLGFQPVLIKIFNLLCLIGIAYQTQVIFEFYGRKPPLFLLMILLPTLIVIHKEFLFGFLVLSFYRYHIRSSINYKSVFIQFIVFLLVFNLRYWAVVPLVLSTYTKFRRRLSGIVRMSFDLLTILVIFVCMGIFVEFLQEKIIQRGIEMYSEGQNYGLSSSRNSLASKYSGSLWYTVLQFFVHPVPSPSQMLYNSFLLIPFALIGLVKIDGITLFKDFGWLSTLILILSLTVIGLQFGSNPRYKFFIAFVIAMASILSANRFSNLFDQIVPLIFFFYLLIIVYARF